MSILARRICAFFAFPTLLMCGVLSVSAAAQDAESIAIDAWLARAIDSAQKINDPEARSYAHYQLVYALARHGDAEEGLQAAQKITNPQHQLYALKQIAEAAFKTGNTELCRSVVEIARPVAIEHAGPFITSEFLNVCFAAGLLDSALEFIDQTYKPYEKPSAYCEVVSEYCARGDRQAAESFVKAKNLGEPGTLAMAQGFIRAKDIPSAATMIESLSDSKLRDGGYVSLATSLAHTDDDVSANRYLGLIENEDRRRDATAEVSRFYNKEESLDEMRPKFAAATSREQKSGMVPSFVQKLVEAKAFAEADKAIEDTVKAIEQDPQPDGSSKFGTYGDASAVAWIRGMHLTIANGLIESGQLDDATAQVAKANEVIKDLSPASAVIKWPLEQALAKVLLDLDREGEAIEIMERSTGPHSRASIAADIAVHRITQGNVDEGLSLIETSGNRQTYGAEKGDIAIALLHGGHDQRAMEFLNSLDDSETSANAFQQLARRLIEQKDFGILLTVFQQFDSPVAQAHLSIEAANRLIVAE